MFENMSDDQWMVMPVPKSEKDGKLYNLINGSYSLSISSNSENPDAAWKLIEFLNRTDNSSEYCRLSGLIPIKKDAAEDEMYGEGGPYYTFTMQLNDPDLVVPATMGAFDYTDMHQGMMHEEIQKYLLGDEDAETALDTIADELETRMKNYLKENPDAECRNCVNNGLIVSIKESADAKTALSFSLKRRCKEVSYESKNEEKNSTILICNACSDFITDHVWLSADQKYYHVFTRL